MRCVVGGAPPPARHPSLLNRPQGSGFGGARPAGPDVSSWSSAYQPTPATYSQGTNHAQHSGLRHGMHFPRNSQSYPMNTCQFQNAFTSNLHPSSHFQYTFPSVYPQTAPQYDSMPPIGFQSPQAPHSQLTEPVRSTQPLYTDVKIPLSIQLSIQQSIQQLRSGPRSQA